MLDTALGAAVQSLLPAGRSSVTVNLNTTYQRPLSVASGPIEATGRATRCAGRLAFAEGHVTDGQGSICVTASATFALLGEDARHVRHASG